MMADLVALASGRLPDTLLPACRLEGFGRQVYAREPVAALFRAHPADLADALVVAGRGAAVVASIDGTTALFADLHDGQIVRLWRLGAAVDTPPALPRVAVPADSDLTQLRTAVRFDPAGHRDLSSEGADAVNAAAELAAAADFGLSPLPFRTRVFVRRAFTVGDATAALFGIVALGGGPVRHPLDFNVVALCFAGSAPTLVVDHAGVAAAQARPWTPHL